MPEGTSDIDIDELLRRGSRGSDRDADRRSGVGDLFRRAIENTVGSVQNTGSLSREAISYLLQQGDKGKREIVRIVANEVGDFLRQVDFSSEIIKVLTSVQMDLNASVKFRRNEAGDGIVPEVSQDSQVSVIATDPPGDDEVFLDPVEAEASEPDLEVADDVVDDDDSG